MKILTIKGIALVTLVSLCTIVIFSCQKDNSSDTTSAITEEEATIYSDESTQAEASFDDVEDIGMIASEEESAASAPMAASALPRMYAYHQPLKNCAGE